MRWIVGLLPCSEVAARVAAIVRLNGQAVVVVDMARRTGDIGVAIGQQEACAAVIEVRAQPTIEGMAAFTVGRGKRRARFRMIRISRILPILQMARIAACG